MFMGFLTLIFFVYLFYNKNLPPVILFSCFFQWLYMQGQLLDGLLKGITISKLDYVSYTKADVTFLGLIGTLLFFLGIYIVIRKVPVLAPVSFNNFLLSIRLHRLVRLYILIYIFLFLAGSLVWLFPGLSQPLYVLTYFRWSIFFLLFCAVFVHDKQKGTLLLIILVEIGLSFVSFFSTFKEVIYFSFLAYWIFYFRSSMFSRTSAMALILVTIYLGALWTTVKEDYRNFLNKGSGVQAVLTTRGAAYSKLLQLTSEVEDKDISQGFNALIDRMSIVGIFDAVYKRVPQKVPYEQGELWLNGITRPFMPRLFFPNKKVLTDSKELNYYSNLNIDEKSTSVSLSMMAGSYVDFGKWGMHVPLFLFGLFCGWIFMKAMRWGGHPVVGYALTMPMIYLLHINEESINRVVSSIVLYFLVLWFIKSFGLKTFMQYITETGSVKPITLTPKV
ncbi:hypothetical protein BH09BAC3_BH09BAC3_13010 [soil metagenome]